MIKIIDLMSARQVFNELSNQQCSGSVSYKIMKILLGSEQEEQFYIKKMKEITDKFAKKKSNGQFELNDSGDIIIQNDKIEDCSNAIKELELTEVENVKYTFTLDEISELKLTPKQMYLIRCFIIDSEDDTPNVEE